MPKIFISYRRSDTASIAGRIYDVLEDAFGRKSIFKDVDEIPPGVDFRSVIKEAVLNANILLVLIGSDWLSASDETGGRRLDNLDDFVRYEISLGLDTETMIVIPVLVEGAHIPSAEDLPHDLKDLVFHNAVIIRNDPDFRSDMRRLVTHLKALTFIETSTKRTFLIILATILMALVLLFGALLLFESSKESGLTNLDIQVAMRETSTAIEVAASTSEERNRRTAVIEETDIVGTLNIRSTLHIINATSNYQTQQASTPVNSTAEFGTAVEARIMTRNANATSIAEIALSVTASETQTPTIDSNATIEMQTMLDEQGTREASTATALFGTQSAQLTANAPTNTALPTDAPIPTATLTPPNTPTSTPNATEIAQFESDASQTAIAQETSIIIEQTRVYETAVAEQQAIATQNAAQATIPFPNGRLIQFHYNDGSFYMQNTSTVRIHLSRIAFQGLNEHGEFTSDIFVGTQWPIDEGLNFVDADGRCVAIELFGKTHLEPELCIPVEGIDLQYNVLIGRSVNTSSIFWRPTDEIAEFAVFWDEQEIARCSTEIGFCEVRVGN